MEYEVHVNRHALNYFRKKARELSAGKDAVEIHAYLIGEVKYPNKYFITSIEHTREYGTQTAGEVAPSGEDWNRVNRKADEQGRRILGDIHTHPDRTDAIMSPGDYQACVTDGTEICGIVAVNGRTTLVRFWHVNSSVPCEIKYDDSAKKTEKPISKS